MDHTDSFVLIIFGLVDTRTLKLKECKSRENCIMLKFSTSVPIRGELTA